MSHIAIAFVVAAWCALFLLRKRIALWLVRRTLEGEAKEMLHSMIWGAIFMAAELVEGRAQEEAAAGGCEGGDCEHCRVLKGIRPADTHRVAEWIGMRCSRENPGISIGAIWTGSLLAAVMIGRHVGDATPETIMQMAAMMLNGSDDVEIEATRIRMPAGGAMPS
jgi:hypothetical protein